MKLVYTVDPYNLVESIDFTEISKVVKLLRIKIRESWGEAIFYVEHHKPYTALEFINTQGEIKTFEIRVSGNWEGFEEFFSLREAYVVLVDKEVFDKSLDKLRPLKIIQIPKECLNSGEVWVLNREIEKAKIEAIREEEEKETVRRVLEVIDYE